MNRFNVAIKGVGAYLPERVITNKDMFSQYGANPIWPKEYLGIEERRWTYSTQNNSDIAYMAAKQAIEDSKLDKTNIDLMILATSSPDRISPSTACIVAEKLELKCPAFDINAVCSGFLYALNVASSLIESKAYKNILIIASETYSKITDTSHRDCVYFGDGAGAIILSSSTTGWISTKIYSDGTGKDGFTTPIGGTFKMDGKAVFNAGTSRLPLAIKELLIDNNVSVDEIRYMVPHQPGIKMLELIAKDINLPFEKVVTVMDKYANIAAASIPIALNHLINKQSLNDGDLLLLATVGSGWTWGAGIIKWEK